MYYFFGGQDAVTGDHHQQEDVHDTKTPAVDVGLCHSKLIITVGYSIVFYITRILAQMLAKDVRLLQEVVSPSHFDRITTHHVLPLLANNVGIDVATHVKDDFG